MSSSGFSPVASSPSVPPWGMGGGGPGPDPARVVVFEFTQADLVAGVFTGVHGLGNPYVAFAVYDNGELVVFPDESTAVDANTFSIDLSSFAPIPGTWHLVVVG